MIDINLMKQFAAQYHRELTQQQLQKFDSYAEFLIEYNEKVNLTAITDPTEIVVKHFLDSILLLNAYDLPINTSIIDIGTGAGFPTVPIKIMREDLKITLLDGAKKRIEFLIQLSKRLSQNNSTVHGRGEELSRTLPYREQYDLATARAVASLSVLCELCLPFVKVGGSFIALKGYDVEQELKQASKAIEQLGGSLQQVKKFHLPMDNKRSFIIIKKISQTPTKYPRNYGTITKKPL